jgi:hypothetical protein
VRPSTGKIIIVAKDARRAGALHVGKLMHLRHAIQLIYHCGQRRLVSLPAFHVWQRNKYQVGGRQWRRLVPSAGHWPSLPIASSALWKHSCLHAIVRRVPRCKHHLTRDRSDLNTCERLGLLLASDNYDADSRRNAHQRQT